MMCLGKSYWNSQKDGLENKENIDHNVIKLKPALKDMKDYPKEPAILKKISEAPTDCTNNSFEPEIDFFNENLKLQYSSQIS